MNRKWGILVILAVLSVCAFAAQAQRLPGQPGFAMSASSQVVKLGATGTTAEFNVTVTALNGLNGTVGLSCQTGTSALRCEVTPTEVQFGGPVPPVTPVKVMVELAKEGAIPPPGTTYTVTVTGTYGGSKPMMHNCKVQVVVTAQ